ncbi:MAG: macro domain-containing protein [archaeon]
MKANPVIEIRKGSIVTLQVHCIVNPANSFGFMGGGVAEAIKKVGGQGIEDEAIEQAPIQVGTAVMTGAGDLVCHKVIHAPTMHNPAEKSDSHKVMCAVKAALELAESEGMQSIAFPGMGTGVGGLDKQEAADVMVSTIKKAKLKCIGKIILIDIDDEMVAAFEKAMNIKERS